MSETGEALEDRFRLEDLVKLLLEFRGNIPVKLEVQASGTLVNLAMPFVHVQLCEDLKAKLSEMLGPDNFRIDPAIYSQVP